MTFDDKHSRLDGAGATVELRPQGGGEAGEGVVTARRPQPDESRQAAKPDPGSEGAGADEASKDKATTDVPFWRRHPLWLAGGALVLVVLAVAGYIYWSIALRPFESTDDAFVDARQFAIAPKVGGYLVDVPVTDNQFVETGATLAQVDRRDYAIAVEQARAQVRSAEASIKSYDAQIEAQNATVDENLAQVEQTKAALQFAQADAARYQDLAQRGAGTVQQSQQSTSNFQQQQASLARANAAVIAARQQIGALQAQKATAEANRAQMQAQQDQAELNLAYTTLKAAQAGRVVRLTGAKGQFVQPGQSVSMFVPNPIWVTANFKETQIDDMRPGQPVEVRIDAYPGHKIAGRVDSVQPGSGTAFSLLPAENATGNYVKVVQRIPVKIVVDDWPTDVAIGPGMSVVPRVRVR